MLRILGAIVLCSFVVAATSAQNAPPPQTTPPQTQPQTQKPAPQPPEVMLHGCVVQGTTPGIFLLTNAINPAKKGDTPKIYRLTAQVEDPDWVSVTNKQVTITGIPGVKPQPKPGEKINEEELPTFSVSKFEAIADTCPSLK
jgi:hypothetical protein